MATGAAGKAENAQLLLSTARSLRADETAGIVHSQLGRADLSPVLLKGPVIREWLYQGGARHYTDVDLLVPDSRWEEATSALAELGYRPVQPGWNECSWSWTASDDLADVDLHRSLFGIGVDPDQAWAVLTRDLETIQLRGREISHLAEPARALHVATHAAQHGGEETVKPGMDLELALARVRPEVWRSALSLAAELDALPALRAGLELLPTGRSVLAELAIESPRSISVDLHAKGAPPLVLAMEHLASQRGIAPRARFIGRKLRPPRGESHARHLLRIASHAPAALLRWRRLRRSS